MIVWEGLEKSVISVDRQIENMLDDKNWDGVIAKAHRTRAALDGRENVEYLRELRIILKILRKLLRVIPPLYLFQVIFSQLELMISSKKIT